MTDNKNLAIFDQAILKGEVTWWQMELPSGSVIFGDAKNEMLGYPKEQFNTYQDFTKLVHPDDYKKIMEAMTSLLGGKTNAYETTYRIKTSSGEYINFYDYGEISQKTSTNTTIIGFVKKIKSSNDVDNEIISFKKLITEGEVSIVDLFGKLQTGN